LHAAQGDLYAANAEVARMEQQRQHERETQHRLTSQLGAWKSQQSQLQQQREQAVESLALWREQHLVTQLKMQESADTLGDERERLPRMEAALSDCQRRHGDLQRDLCLVELSLKIEEAHRSHARNTVQQLQTRRERLQHETAGLPRPDPAELTRRRGELEELAGALAQNQARQQALQARLPALEQAQQAARQAEQAARQQANRLDAQRHALRQMQSRLEHNHKLKDWLARHQLEDLPRLWNGICIESGWETALESVLGERLQAIALDCLEPASAWLADAPPAPLALYEAGAPGATPGNGMLAPLRQWVSGPAGLLDEWLEGVYAASSPDEAWSLRHRLLPGECLVCREGHVFTRSSVNFYAPRSELHGVLARQREIAALEVEVERAQAELATREGEAMQLASALKAAQHELAESRRANSEAQQRHHHQQLETERLAQQQQHLSQRREQIGQELGEIAAQLEIEREQIGEHDYNIERQEERLALLRERLEDAGKSRGEAEALLNRQRQLVQSAERAAQEAVFQHKNAIARIDEFERAVAALTVQLEELAGRLVALEGEAGRLRQGNLDTLLQQALQSRQEKENRLALARDALAEAGNALQRLEQQRINSEHRSHPLRDRLEQARLNEQEARLAEEQWQAQLDAADADLEALLPLLEKRPKAAELQDEVERLAREIEALGAVNLAALEELNSGRERKQYLDAQFQDLSEAMDTLEQAIRRIDRETRARLLETFDTVNRHFGELFPAVFGGGHARLEMTGDEILDAGVTLTAQPPGKKNSSLQLLSGGEKALTALALVFAMFRLNPAPFCMLDEVDAPLDDSNTERFCELVKKMSPQTQFIFVSHNKITMEMAEQLVGVTMQESGVSRVVTVDLEEAVKLKDAAAL
ncbi:MAG: chromosome segregation protein SMC, partial [Sulfurimicrobium sp.]